MDVAFLKSSLTKVEREREAAAASAAQTADEMHAMGLRTKWKSEADHLARIVNSRPDCKTCADEIEVLERQMFEAKSNARDQIRMTRRKRMIALLLSHAIDELKTGLEEDIGSCFQVEDQIDDDDVSIISA